jgi:hypothetical protein
LIGLGIIAQEAPSDAWFHFAIAKRVGKKRSKKRGKKKAGNNARLVKNVGWSELHPD